MPPQFEIRRDIRGESQARAWDRRIAALADRQHGVVGREQLAGLAIGDDGIDRRLAAGRLHQVHRGVYAVGYPRLTRQGRWMAATLAGGEGAALSHRSAAELWGILPPSSRTPEVTIAISRRQRQGIRWRFSALPADEVDRVDGIPVTTPARTLLDLAAVLDRHRLARVIDRAQAMRLASPTSLPALLERYPRRRGAAKLKSVIDEGRIGLAVTRSELEDAFLVVLDRYGLPRPETNVPLRIGGGWVEVDCVWRRQRLIVELDGRVFHGTAGAFEADRARDRALIAAGWRVIRVTWRQLTREPAALAADLRASLARTLH